MPNGNMRTLIVAYNDKKNYYITTSLYWMPHGWEIQLCNYTG